LKAIAEARATGHDCVLVDTAGRMQNNGKLMQELAKLVQVVKGKKKMKKTALRHIFSRFGSHSLLLTHSCFQCLTPPLLKMSSSSIFHHHHHHHCNYLKVNKPNLLLFVGEALVGNDGIDQLTMFNKVMSGLLLC